MGNARKNLLLLLFYTVTGIAQQSLAGRLNRRVVLEFVALGTVLAAFIGISAWQTALAGKTGIWPAPASEYPSQSEQIGYSNLVESWLGKTIDKGARFTDWSRRPLTERQIEYAIGDVTHLAEIFPKILKKLVKTGRGAWLDAEMEKLADPENYRTDPDKAWKRIRQAGRNPQVLGRLKALAWRSTESPGR